MKKVLLICFSILIFGVSGYSQNFDESRFGASVAQWADSSEGWDNFPLLGVHYCRMPIDIPKGAMIDNFFLKQYDTLFCRAQQHGLIIYAIINPRQNLGQFASTSELATAINSIVERYDGDGISDMPGLQNPIKNWEVCNEVMYDTIANNPGSPGYPLWVGFTKAQYLDYMDTARDVITNTCADCFLFNGAQLLPPSSMFSSICDLTAPVPTGEGPDVIDKICYHDYTEYFEINQAVEDFTNCGIGNKPIWIVEAGMQNEYIQDSSLTQEENAKRAVKSFAYVFTKGVEKVIYTTMRAGLSDQESIQWESLLDPATGARKKVFWAYKKLIEKIDYFTSVDTIFPHNDSTVFAIKFMVSGKPVYILWSDIYQTVNINLSSTSVSGVVVTRSVPDDTLGNFDTQNISATAGQVSLDISPEAIYVEEDLVTNIPKEESGLSFGLYPNPAENTVFIESQMNADISIFNLPGGFVQSKKISKSSDYIDISVLPAGVYIVKLTTHTGASAKILIKQ